MLSEVDAAQLVVAGGGVNVMVLFWLVTQVLKLQRQIDLALVELTYLRSQATPQRRATDLPLPKRMGNRELQT